mgnify:CR=1 FL=1
MCVLGIDDEELTGFDQCPCGTGIGVEGKVIFLVERSLALSHSRDMLHSYEFGLSKGDMDVDVLAMGFQFGTGNRNKFCVHHIDEKTVAVQFYTASRNFAEIVGLDVVKGLLEQRMQSLVAGTVLKMGLYHGDEWTHPNPPYMEGNWEGAM